MFRRRTIFLAVLFGLAFGGALARLAYLQVARADEFRRLRDARVRATVTLVPRRGAIVDAAGAVLAADRPSYDLWLVPAEIRRVNRRRVWTSLVEPLSFDRLTALARVAGDARPVELRLVAAEIAATPLARRVAGAAGLTPEEAGEKIARALPALTPRREEKYAWSEPVRLVEDIDFARWVALRADRARDDDDPVARALETRVGYVRHYPQGESSAHLVGWVGPLSAEEYVTLRGRWPTEEEELERLALHDPAEGPLPPAEPVPGAGQLVSGGRVVLSVLPDREGGDATDEAKMLRLQERRRAGRTERIAPYLPDARIGRAGLEQYYNQRLRGRHALQPMERRAGRGYVPRGEVKAAVDGERLRLTIDLAFQQKVEAILADAVARQEREPLFRRHALPLSAAAVVMDVHNGRLHALANVPGYDPNRQRLDYARWIADPTRPLDNRAVEVHYQPGSVMKPFTGFVALAEHAVLPGQKILCEGFIKVGGEIYRCLKRTGHGELNLVEALEVSCNPYFMRAGEATGGVRLARGLADFGFGTRTGIDLPREARGRLPAEMLAGRRMATGYTYLLAMGQGHVDASPLQVAVAFAALANADEIGAKLVRPHLLLPGPGSPDADRRLDQPVKYLAVDPRMLSYVRQGMWEVVQGDRGTAGAARLDRFDGGFAVAGKTGSAQVELPRVWLDRLGITAEYVKKELKLSHAWMAAYAPYEKPEVVVVVVVPFGNLGGATCAPIVREILRAYFRIPDIPVLDAVG